MAAGGEGRKEARRCKRSGWLKVAWLQHEFPRFFVRSTRQVSFDDSVGRNVMAGLQGNEGCESVKSELNESGNRKPLGRRITEKAPLRPSFISPYPWEHRTDTGRIT
jgi:hypothetical protein